MMARSLAKGASDCKHAGARDERGGGRRATEGVQGAGEGCAAREDA